jgi:hypothetical protein
LVTKAVEEGTLRRPALVVATPEGQPNILVGARAYRNDRLGDLTGSLTMLSKAAARALFAKQAPLIDGIAFVVGSGLRVERMLRDGVSAGDFVDVASLVTGALVHARGVAAPVVTRGPDDGTRSDPVRPPGTLDNVDAVLGVIAKTRSGVMLSGMVPSPFERMARSEPRPFAQVARAYGSVNPLIGAGFGLMDVLSDPWFWKSLEEGRKPAPVRFRYSGTDGMSLDATTQMSSGANP